VGGTSFDDNGKLLFFGIIPGKVPTTYWARFMAVKNYTLTCQQPALDDID
jgi:hypothetical protein